MEDDHARERAYADRRALTSRIFTLLDGSSMMVPKKVYTF